MDSYIIQVKPQDELTVVVDKVIHTQAARVYLLVPEGSRIAQHVLNFRLLKREADALRKEIVVVSSSERVQSLALKASLQVHQETSELRRGAAMEGQEKISVPPRLADIVPSPHRSRVREPQKEKEADIAPPPSRAAPSSKSPKSSKTPKTDTTSQERKIIGFWMRQPSLRAKDSLITLPKHAHRLVSGVKLPRVALDASKFFHILLWGLVGASLVVTTLTFYFVLPRAKIFISPVVEEVESEIFIQASAHISEANLGSRIVPAQIFEQSLDDSRTIISSGERDIQEKAEGLIRVYNAYSSAPQTLVATTRFVSESGKLFRTKETIVVRGAEVEGGKIIPSFTEVVVIASKSGEEHNIGPSTFSIPGFKGTDKYLGFYGKSVSSMEGGQVGRVKVITSDDYTETRSELIKSLKARAQDDLALTIPEGFFIISGAQELSDVQISSTGQPQEVADELTVFGSISSKAFAIRRSDVEKIIKADFTVKFPGKNLILSAEGVTYQVRRSDFAKGSFEIDVLLSQQVASIVDEAEIRQAVRGKDESGVRAFLSSHPSIREARVTFWPFWVNQIPADTAKIEITVE